MNMKFFILSCAMVVSTFAHSNSLSITSKAWTGANGTSWDDAANWEPAGVPTSANAVTISSGTVLASAVVDAASLTIADGATLMVGSTGGGGIMPL